MFYVVEGVWHSVTPEFGLPGDQLFNAPKEQASARKQVRHYSGKIYFPYILQI